MIRLNCKTWNTQAKRYLKEGKKKINKQPKGNNTVFYKGVRPLRAPESDSNKHKSFTVSLYNKY